MAGLVCTGNALCVIVLHRIFGIAVDHKIYAGCWMDRSADRASGQPDPLFESAVSDITGACLSVLCTDTYWRFDEFPISSVLSLGISEQCPLFCIFLCMHLLLRSKLLLELYTTCLATTYFLL